ncbi:snf1-kinase beta subunit, plants, putative [Ricinus communis]|uniref:Snf1-kinase beta subunit, plants, putative n=1 Tax=Ricinus communis TaxID=3988 RepID=B9SW41_RICCO|nr:snf1-kinase beta subunit, plants, putative [Ricinus communis]|eukprot:XP_002530210.1 SNF1-related protein kinase regulatory subunit beta-2 [Ricinus communis]
MGNASGKNDGEGSTGEGYEQEGMEFAAAHDRGVYIGAEPMVHSAPLSPRTRRYLQLPLIFTPQVPAIRLPRTAEMIRVQNYALAHNTVDSLDAFSEKLNAVMITWSYGGKQVAVTGSWDNWEKREPLHKSGKDFAFMKMLPSSVFRYRFIVDEHLRYAPDLPWECDESGIAYNILDVQDDVPEAPESLSEFEAPPSPITSYDNESLDDTDFSKQPPDIPPQLQLTMLNDRSAAESHPTLPRPRHAVLNHLYIQNNRGQPVALGTSHRFLHKYVTVVLYKPSRR